MVKFVSDVCILFLNLFSVFSPPISFQDNETLELVHVIFRHGDRTSEKSFNYPTDPNANETFDPYGRGELTKKGKKRMYNLGKSLRERYDSFLGKSYHPEIIESWSSLRNRTQASLQLVLAGLFPPTVDDLWDDGVLWQPIPYRVSPKKLFLGITCPNYVNLYNEYVNSQKHRSKIEKFKNVTEFVTKHSGRNITGIMDLLLFFLDLQSDEEFGLKLAPWIKEIYPKKLEEIALVNYAEFTANTQLRRLAIGFLLEKILNDSINKIKGNSPSKNRKIFLYSGHEITLGIFLETLGIFKEQIPPYSSYIILEIHRINGTHGVKIYFEDYSKSSPELLKLPACEEFCEISKFSSLIEEFIPTKQDNQECNE